MAEDSARAIASPAARPASLPGSFLRHLSAVVLSMRPKQWTKSGIVFLAFIFSVNQHWTPEEPSTWDHLVVRALLTAIVFSLASGADYLVNDIRDREQDRLHPRKSRRPIASGQLTPGAAWAWALALSAVAIAGGFLIDWRTGAVVAGYLALMQLYTYYLKHEVILDVMAIAAGFVLRAVAGAYAIDVPISPWLYVVTGLGALFLAITKRRAEVMLLQDGAGEHRRTLEHYSLAFLDQMTDMVTASTVIAYALYTFTAPNLPDNHAMMLTVPFVIYGLFRYLYLSHVKNEGGSPEEVLLKDVPLLLTVIGWVATSLVVLTAYR
jgi:4-hydroxybenzoate polyprenyltransferase